MHDSPDLKDAWKHLTYEGSPIRLIDVVTQIRLERCTYSKLGNR